MLLRGEPHLSHPIDGRRVGSGRREAARSSPFPSPPSPGDDARRVRSLPTWLSGGVEDYRRAAVAAHVATMVVTESSHGLLPADARPPLRLITRTPSAPGLLPCGCGYCGSAACEASSRHAAVAVGRRQPHVGHGGGGSNGGGSGDRALHFLTLEASSVGGDLQVRLMVRPDCYCTSTTGARSSSTQRWSWPRVKVRWSCRCLAAGQRSSAR